ncbi:polysaccharide biosynthesis/export family protein [Microvirga sp. VF16]|uniref:polysaccharide biosynthesis/export family protein n=1 Tax=Microvirga sp. VF16 TaxID=2807101 RepID=UPI00193CD156|nr:polysaccharide biosynthesis/export family protein [Microvirga sp. VF16]QRM27233.1 polysaccharide biosynthesis/export family protein [Microvirga sp. VF16]
MSFYYKSQHSSLPSIKKAMTIALTLLSFGSSGVSANYLIAPGDVIEISVVSLPELRQRAVVNIEGQVSYPLIGTLNVAGLSLSDLQHKLKNELTNKSVRSRASDGSERAIYIYPEEISAVIVEHRPIYVNGDVSKPGELAFRPGMTIRQAVALSGGLDVMRLRTGDPALQEMDLQLESQLLRTEYLRQKAIISRLLGELNRGPENSQKADNIPPAEGISKIQKAQTEELELSLEDHRKEVGSLGRFIEQTESQIITLGRMREELMQSYQQQANEVARLKANFEKGLAPIARISEEQRALSFVSERLLQTEAELAVAKRGREEQRRQLEKAEDQRRLRLMRELEGAENRLSELRTRIQGTDGKLAYAGVLKSQLLEDSGGKPNLKVFRRIANTWESYEAEFEMELMPGDVVEIALQRNSLKASQ